MLEITRGTCYVQFAFDVAFSIDLAQAETRIREETHRTEFKYRRRAPKYFRYEPAPVRFTQNGSPVEIAGHRTNPAAEVLIYDFGGISVTYSIPLEGSLSRLLTLSNELYEHSVLLNHARQRIETLLEVLQSAVTKPGVSGFVEDYVVFQMEGLNPPLPIGRALSDHRREFAQILRAETAPLSDDEVNDSLSHRISFTEQDVAVIDWNGAVVIDREPEDTLAVIEFANMELMEMRYLDNRLDRALGLAYETLAQRAWRRFPFGSNPAEMHRVAQWQVESAMLFEGVNNALKLLGDQYLARVYRLAAERFHLSEWDATIIRKLETLNSIYGKISDQVANRRMEALEWIIIALIAFDIVWSFI
jgi:hypothetical protein